MREHIQTYFLCVNIFLDNSFSRLHNNIMRIRTLLNKEDAMRKNFVPSQDMREQFHSELSETFDALGVAQRDREELSKMWELAALYSVRKG